MDNEERELFNKDVSAAEKWNLITLEGKSESKLFRGRKSWLWGCWQAAVWETEQIKPGEVSKGKRMDVSEQSVRDRKDEEIHRRDTGKKKIKIKSH